MQNYLSVQTTMFTLFGYEMSYLEFVGTLFNLACVWLVAKKNIWNWPIGIIGTILFTFLFFQVQLYSDMLLQVWFTLTGVWGWVAWSKKRDENPLQIAWCSNIEYLWYWVAIIVGTYTLGFAARHIHEWLPTIFRVPAAFAYTDAFVTAMSIAATVMMIYKRIESWILWILVNIISIGMYYMKDIVFVSLLYVVFLVIATRGFFIWKADYDKRRTDRCNICKGANGGVYGNENVIHGELVCDYCHVRMI